MVQEVFSALQAELQNMGESMKEHINHSSSIYEKKKREYGADKMSSSFRDLFFISACQDTNCGDILNNEYEEETVEYDWRRNPKRSLSDYTLVVYNGIASKSFHVHKSILTYGSRRSDYFVRMLIESMDNSEGMPNKNKHDECEVYLPPLAAKTVPQLLDFIYDNSKNVLSSSRRKSSVKSWSLPALRYLANYFDVRELYRILNRLMKKDFNATTAPLYCVEAQELKDTELSKLSIELCATETIHLEKGESIFQLPPNLFYQVLSCPSLYKSTKATRRTEMAICKKVAQYLRLKDKEMTDEHFFFLTHPNIMPTIDPKEAYFFLSYTQSKFPEMLSNEDSNFTDGKKSWRRRCIEACAKSWATTLTDSISQIHSTKQNDGKNSFQNNVLTPCYETIPGDLKLEMLELALLEARNDALTITRTSQDNNDTRDASYSDYTGDSNAMAIQSSTINVSPRRNELFSRKYTRYGNL